MCLPQTAAQHICEERMIAIPVPLVIERGDEEISLFQFLQDRLPVGAPGERVAQCAGHPIEDRREQQK